MAKTSVPPAEKKPVKKRGTRAGSRQDVVQRMSVSHSLCEAQVIRCADTSSIRVVDQAVASARQAIRQTLHPVITRAKRTDPVLEFQLNTGSFRTDAGDYVVVGVITRTA